MAPTLSDIRAAVVSVLGLDPHRFGDIVLSAENISTKVRLAGGADRNQDLKRLDDVLLDSRRNGSLPEFFKWLDTLDNPSCGRKKCLDDATYCIKTLKEGNNRKCAVCSARRRRCPLQIAWEITSVVNKTGWGMERSIGFIVETKRFLIRGMDERNAESLKDAQVTEKRSDRRAKKVRWWTVISDEDSSDSDGSSSDTSPDDRVESGISSKSPRRSGHPSLTMATSGSTNAQTLTTPPCRGHPSQQASLVRVHHLEAELEELRDSLESVKADAQRASERHSKIQTEYQQRISDAEHLIQELLNETGEGVVKLSAGQNASLQAIENLKRDVKQLQVEERKAALIFTLADFACDMKQRLPLIKVMLDRVNAVSEGDQDMVVEAADQVEECLTKVLNLPLKEVRGLVESENHRLKRAKTGDDVTVGPIVAEGNKKRRIEGGY